MSNTFEWTRFCKVVRKDFGNIWQNAGITFLIISLLPLIAWLLSWALASVGSLPSIAPEVRWGFILIVVALAVMVTPSRMYRTCNLSKEGIYFAMLPASKLEKYMSMLLYTIVICPMMCLLGSIVLDYFLALLPFGAYDKWLWETDYLAEGLDGYRMLLLESQSPHLNENARLLVEVVSPGRIILYAVLSYLTQAALFMFTATIFKKHKVLQTILWVWLIGFVLQIILLPLNNALISDGWVNHVLESANPVRVANQIYWIGAAWVFVKTTVFFWWAGYRLNKMRY